MKLAPGTPGPPKKALRNSAILVGTLCLSAAIKSFWGYTDDHAGNGNPVSVASPEAHGTIDDSSQIDLVNQLSTNPPSNASTKTPPTTKAFKIKPLTSADPSQIQAWAMNGMRLLSEASKSLQKEIAEVGWSDSASNIGLDIPGEIERRIAYEDNAIRIFNKYEQHELKLLNNWRETIPTLNLNLEDQQSVLAWLNRLFSPDSLSRNFNSKTKLCEISKKRLQLLHKTRGHWSIQNNQIMFMRDKDYKADLQLHKAQESVSNSLLKDKMEFETIFKEDGNKLGIKIF
ncbi:hypothetical protein [Geothrix sp. SG200]|uniref:hypothetical protein n=1 Tax=Geothrix sp. SG200 TaxID=2922865 RepID=UPI001FAD3C82|nr:hypothetical protein [Geothrix sp. SG200]